MREGLEPPERSPNSRATASIILQPEQELSVAQAQLGRDAADDQPKA